MNGHNQQADAFAMLSKIIIKVGLVLFSCISLIMATFYVLEQIFFCPCVTVKHFGPSNDTLIQRPFVFMAGPELSNSNNASTTLRGSSVGGGGGATDSDEGDTTTEEDNQDGRTNTSVRSSR